MKANIFVVVLVCIVFCTQSYGQEEIYCPVTTPFDTTEGGALNKLLPQATLPDTGYQNVVILFVDFPEGRKPNGTLPTVDVDTVYFPGDSIDAVGGMGWVVDSTKPGFPLRKKIRKYTYDNYWDMYFSENTFFGSAHPDSASHGTLAYGSFKDYYKEVSYGKLTIVPYQTWPGTADKYHTIKSFFMCKNIGGHLGRQLVRDVII